MQERVGMPFTAGLRKNDPFPRTTCDVRYPACLVGAGCGGTLKCYQISCVVCDPQSKKPATKPVIPPEETKVPGSRYVGLSGTSLHLRMRSYTGSKTGILFKHRQEDLMQDKDEETLIDLIKVASWLQYAYKSQDSSLPIEVLSRGLKIGFRSHPKG